MSAPLDRVELWTDLQCASGTLVAVLVLASCTATDEISGVLVSHTLAVTVPREWEDADELTVGRVLCVRFTDASFDEYRISEVRDGSGPGNGVRSVTGLGVEYDLGARNLLVSETVDTVVSLSPIGAGLTPTSHLTTYVDAFLPSHFSVGTVTPTATCDVQYDSDTPLSAALKIVAAANLAAGVAYEFSVRRNGVAGYYLDLTAYGSSATAPDLRTAKNLLGVTRTQRADVQTTRVYPVGSDGGTIGDNWFKVSAVSLNAYIDIVDINGSGVNPILADDQFNTTFYWIHEDGVAHQITDTTQATARLAMASTTGIAVGEWGRIAANSSGDQVAYVDHPTAQTSHGIRVGILRCATPSHTNWLKNPDARTWTGANPGKPDDWASGNATKITTAGLFRTGGQSARITDAGAAGTISNTRTVWVPAGAVVSYSVWLYLSAVGGLFDLIFADAIGGTSTVDLSAEESGVWKQFTATFANSGAAASRTLSVAVTASGAGVGTYCYVDAVQAVVARAAASADVVLGSGAATNWLRGAQHLRTNADPVTSYEVEVLDLYRADPTGAGLYEVLSLGATTTLTDTVLGVSDDPRVIRRERNLLVPHDTRIGLSTLPSRLTGSLAA